MKNCLLIGIIILNMKLLSAVLSNNGFTEQTVDYIENRIVAGTEIVKLPNSNLTRNRLWIDCKLINGKLEVKYIREMIFYSNNKPYSNYFIYCYPNSKYFPKEFKPIILLMTKGVYD